MELPHGVQQGEWFHKNRKQDELDNFISSVIMTMPTCHDRHFDFPFKTCVKLTQVQSTVIRKLQLAWVNINDYNEKCKCLCFKKMLVISHASPILDTSSTLNINSHKQSGSATPVKCNSAKVGLCLVLILLTLIHLRRRHSETTILNENVAELTTEQTVV